MYKKCKSLFSTSLFLSFNILMSSNTIDQSKMIDHVVQSISNANLEISQLSEEVLQLEGMSSNKVRHLLNNICSMGDGRYLEIGVWKGSTFVSALYKNNLLSAIAIDNWSEFSGPKEMFQQNLSSFLSKTPHSFYEADCFQFNLNNIENKINIYFFDGAHTQEDQRLAFTYYNEVLDDTFIAIVDDYNWTPVQDGTQIAFKQLGYKVLFEQYLPSAYNGDLSSWWNGIYVAVVSKQ